MGTPNSPPPPTDPVADSDAEFSLRRIAVAAFGPSLLFGIGEGAVLPVIVLMARDLGASVPIAALVVGLVSIGSLLSNIPASRSQPAGASAGRLWPQACGARWAWPCAWPPSSSGCLRWAA